MTTVKMTKSGAVVLPKAVVEAHGLKEGAELRVIDDGGDEIRLHVVKTKAALTTRTITVKEFLAMRIPYDGPDITDDMIRQGIEEEARRRWHEENSH